MGESCYLCKVNEALEDASLKQGEKKVHSDFKNHFSPINKALNSKGFHGNISSFDNTTNRIASVHDNERNSTLMELQKTHGNQYTQQVAVGVQAKLKISEPRDIYEQEADRVADQVMLMPDPQKIRHECPKDKNCPLELEEKKKKGLMQLKTDQSAGGKIFSPNHLLNNLGIGQHLDRETKNFMEPRFGHDFSDVRVYADLNAVESARKVNALAFTVGRKIVFGASQYAPKTTKGQKLLAHELTHVVQQTGKNNRKTIDNSHWLESNHTPSKKDRRIFRSINISNSDKILQTQVPQWEIDRIKKRHQFYDGQQTKCLSDVESSRKKCIWRGRVICGILGGRLGGWGGGGAAGLCLGFYLNECETIANKGREYCINKRNCLEYEWRGSCPKSPYAIGDPWPGDIQPGEA
jgi:hypothetical protein